jgi:hypothetical protein
MKVSCIVQHRVPDAGTMQQSARDLPQSLESTATQLQAFAATELGTPPGMRARQRPSVLQCRRNVRASCIAAERADCAIATAG